MDENDIQIECAHCGNTQLMQIPGTWTPMPMGENGLVQGPAVPLVLLGCPKCGFVELFSPQRIKPAPFPENEPAAQEKK